MKTTTWCHHIHCRRLHRIIDRIYNFTIVITTLIDAIFWTLYTVMTQQNILRVGLKDKLFVRSLTILTNLYAYIRNEISLSIFVFIVQSSSSLCRRRLLKTIIVFDTLKLKVPASRELTDWISEYPSKDAENTLRCRNAFFSFSRWYEASKK